MDTQSKPTVLIAGDRQYDDAETITNLLDKWISRIGKVVVADGWEGTDPIVRTWALSRKLPVHRFFTNWKRHGKSAAYKRDAEIFEKARPDVVIAFPGSDCINVMKLGLKAKAKVITVDETGGFNDLANPQHLDLGELDRQGMMGSEMRQGSWEQTRARPLTEAEKTDRDYLYYMTPDAEDTPPPGCCEACGLELSPADEEAGESTCQICLMDDELPAFRGDGRLDIL